MAGADELSGILCNMRMRFVLPGERWAYKVQDGSWYVFYFTRNYTYLDCSVCRTALTVSVAMRMVPLVFCLVPAKHV